VDGARACKRLGQPRRVGEIGGECLRPARYQRLQAVRVASDGPDFLALGEEIISKRYFPCFRLLL